MQLHLQTSKRGQNSFGICGPEDVGTARFACRMHIVLTSMLEIYLDYATFLWLQFFLMYLGIAFFLFFSFLIKIVLL